MMKKVWLVAVLFLSMVLSMAPAQAQTEDIDSTLARAAARGYLLSLTRPDLVPDADFYLVEDLDGEALSARWQGLSVDDFEITQVTRSGENGFEANAVLLPSKQPVSISVSKHDGRWLVDGILQTVEVQEAQQAAPVNAEPAAGFEDEAGVLAFQTGSGSDIYLINADGGGLRRLTHGLDPQLAPDGQQLTFTRWEPDYGLYTIDIDGSQETLQASGYRQMKSPSWTADGSGLVFSHQSGGRLETEEHQINLAKMAISGENPRIPGNARELKVEDGLLSYVIPPDAHWHLAQLDLEDGDVTDLGAERHSYGPSAHPTQAGQVIYKGQQGLALHDIESGRDQAVSTDFRDRTPVISPDGSQVAVSYWQDNHWELHLMNIDGSGRRRLTDTPLDVRAQRSQLTREELGGQSRLVPPGQSLYWNNAAPTWSPDGKRIAFLTDRTGQWEIWIMNADGSAQRPMFPNGELGDIDLNYDGMDERVLSWR